MASGERPRARHGRIGVVAALGLNAAALVVPQQASAQPDQLSSCLAIADMAARVACYDAIARRQVETPVAVPTPAPTPAPAPAPAPRVEAPAAAPAATERPVEAGTSAKAEFGFSPAERERLLPAEQQQLVDLTFTVGTARLTGPGYWQFEMKEGSTWRLAESRRAFRAPGPGDAVVIRRGSLGSYFLDFDDQPGMRIKRLR
ncbi:hypothetical protein GRI75_13120 [Altererythrobacter soli]|uniref:Uncharacterized protein n=1 Tax=Croceibacterium soli TaxID=1739690 RepID=A0A6I4UUH8_9SPHN|nr:hypothetical protein [Croceibacterium soli]MXP42580.1 hypothetical protein [Croceibacterium soli]